MGKIRPLYVYFHLFHNAMTKFDCKEKLLGRWCAWDSRLVGSKEPPQLWRLHTISLFFEVKTSFKNFINLTELKKWIMLLKFSIKRQVVKTLPCHFLIVNWVRRRRRHVVKRRHFSFQRIWKESLVVFFNTLSLPLNFRREEAMRWPICYHVLSCGFLRPD